MPTLLHPRLATRAGFRRPPDPDEFKVLADRFEQFERNFVAQMRDDLVSAEIRQAQARIVALADRLGGVRTATERLSEAVDVPAQEPDETLADAIRSLREEFVRSLAVAAAGTVFLVLVTFVFVVSR